MAPWPLTYAAITPARDERDNLPRLFASLAAQTVMPLAWIVVDNGSSDGTPAYVEELSAEHPWVHLARSEGGARYTRTGRPYIVAFHAGVAALESDPDVLVKLDADVSVAPDFFERIIGAFRRDPNLGITSGSCWELAGDQWQRRPILEDHVWGPTRCYRWPELNVVLPLEEDLGYAQVDETKARLAGWRTGTQHELPFRHHRPEGSGDGSRSKAWFSEGEASYFVGYRPTFVLARTAYRMRSELSAAAIVAGYLSAFRRRAPRVTDESVRRSVRDRQRLRVLARRAVAALRAPRREAGQFPPRHREREAGENPDTQR
jgi:glycosyltransferase involved in cell wall biosynthesis